MSTSNMQYRTPLLVIAILLLLGGIAFYAYRGIKNGEQIYCTQEAKLCTDGSYVGRSGPECKFAACPGITLTDNDVSLTYPRKLWTTYVSFATWPPTVKVQDGPLACTDIGSENTDGSPGRRTIDGREYCVATVVEGAAGSMYTTYDYSFEEEGKVVTISFSLRRVQCMNYEEATRLICQQEQEMFSVDNMVAEMAASFELK